MGTFTGQQMSLAIEDLATSLLLEAETVLERAINTELSSVFNMDPDLLPRRLVNGLMRGSTSINKDQILKDIQDILKYSSVTRDAHEIRSRILFNIDDERKQIHVARTQKSGVRQILRALNEEFALVPTVSSDVDRASDKQEELNERVMQDTADLYIWGEEVQRLYEQMFVDRNLNDSSSSRRPKGIVTSGANRNYTSIWFRFIENNASYLVNSAPHIDLGVVADKFRKSVSRLSQLTNSISSATGTEVTLKIQNSGPNSFEFSKSWKSKDLARFGISDFMKSIQALMDPNELMDFAEVEISGDEDSSAKFSAISPKKFEAFVKTLI